MAMTEIRRVGLDAFLPVLFGKVAAVPRSVALQQLRLSLNEFCKFSLYWEEDLGTITPDPDNRHGYELALPRGVKPVGDLQVMYASNDNPVPADLYRRTNPQTVVFDAGVNEPVKLVVAVNLIPTGAEVPETLLNYFGEAIAAGAAKRLVVMPQRDWSDPTMAQYHESEYREGYNEACRESRERFDSRNTHRRLDRRSTYY